MKRPYMAKQEESWIGTICTLGMFGVLFIAMMGGMAGSPTPSNSSDFDTSESARRKVTDQMVRQGSDAVEAEAFTKELYKAQREWERNR